MFNPYRQFTRALFARLTGFLAVISIMVSAKPLQVNAQHPNPSSDSSVDEDIAMTFRQMIESSPGEGLSHRADLLPSQKSFAPSSNRVPQRADSNSNPQNSAPYSGFGHGKSVVQSVSHSSHGYYAPESTSSAPCDSMGWDHPQRLPNVGCDSCSRLPATSPGSQPSETVWQQSTPRYVTPAPCSQCRQPTPSCRCNQPRRQVHHVVIQQPQCDEPAEEPATGNDMPTVPPGSFVTGPQTGDVVGPSRSLGIRGMKFTLPAITLALPSIELPSFIRRSRAPRMEMDASQAAFVADSARRPATNLAGFQMPMQSFGNAAFSRTASAQAVARPTAAKAKSEPDEAAALEKTEKEFEALQQRCAKLETLLTQMIEAAPVQSQPVMIQEQISSEVLPAPQPTYAPQPHPPYSQPSGTYYPQPVRQIPCDELPSSHYPIR